MQRNKYLDDLRIPIEEYGTNFVKDNGRRSRKWKKERKIYGFDNRETWNLDSTFAEWLYSRLMMYKEVNIVDLTHYKFIFEGKEYTQIEAIDHICEACKGYLLDRNNDKNIIRLQRATKLFADILPVMWW